MTPDSISLRSLLGDASPADTSEAGPTEQRWVSTGDFWTLEDEQRPAYYWGEVPQDEMREILTECRESGWEETVSKRVPERLQGMITDGGRSDWLELLDSPPKTALDIGSGWGQTSFLTAQRFPGAQVVAIEPIHERAEFQAVRAEQERMDNLHVLSARLNDVDLPEASFDVCSMIGVLEWVAVNEPEPDPRDSQLAALRRMRACLRPGGSMIVGIENRVGINTFLGAVDHSGLRFTSLMPRKLAEKWCALRTPTYRASDSVSSYRTYTYSRQGYIDLFTEAGFSDVEVWIALPHYARPKCLIDTRTPRVREQMRAWRPGTQRQAVMKYLLDAADRVKLAGELSPNFVIRASVR